MTTPAHRPWMLVTGAAQRLGRAVSLAAGAHGWNIIAHFNASRGPAEALVAELSALGARAHAIGADLDDSSAAQSLLPHAAAAAGGPLTALVNCAAIFEHDVIDTLTPETFARHMRINALAPALLTRAFAEALPPTQRGVIINFLDFKLAQPYPDHFSYTLSKYALAGATEMLARALAPRIRVNAVAPGYVLPAPEQAQADFERLHAQTPLERGATPQDIAAAVLYLVGAESVTGQTIHVDAGLRFVTRERDLAFS